MDWIKVLEQTPLSLAIIAGGAWMIRQGAIWMADRILGPIVERHLRFLDELEKLLNRVISSQETLLQELRNVVRVMEPGDSVDQR